MSVRTLVRACVVAAAALSLFALGCRDDKKAAPPSAAGAGTEAAPADRAASAAPASGKSGAAAAVEMKAKTPEEPAQPVHADPGPMLTMKAGVSEGERGPEATATADAQLVHGGHVYVRAPLPNGLWGSDEPSDGMLLVRVAAPARGAAVAAVSGGKRHILVRLVADAVPEEVALTIHAGTDNRWRDRRPARTTRLTVNGLSAAAKTPAVKGDFFRELSAFFERWGKVRWAVRPFYGFAHARTSLMNGGSAKASTPTARARRSELGDLMALYTGATSVQEALQVDRGLLNRDAARSAATVPLADVAGVPLVEHPWEEMLTELGKKPVVEPLASRVPADMLYMHFSDLRTAVRMMKDVDGWVTPLAQLLDGRPGTQHLSERYQEQLMVERIGLAERLGHIAADGVAVAASDPFFREGADVSLLFKVRQRAALDAALAHYEAGAHTRHSDLAEEKLDIAGHAVRRVYTPDGTVNQHRVELDGVLILSNSRRALERLIATVAAPDTALSSSGDFRYMRALYPWSQEEDGFIFLSDRFVAKTVGPRAKILSARRVEAAADLAAVGYAALLHGWLEGTPATSVEDMLKSGVLRAGDLKHGDGTPIRFSPDKGAWSEGWGRLAALKPLIELDIDRVTEAERKAYDRFRTTYQRYWKTYVDPVAVRLTRSDDGRQIEVDGRILPLIEASDYDQIVRDVGRARITAPDMKGVIHWQLAVGDDVRLRRELDGMAKLLGDKDINVGWLGDWVMVGALGRSALWDLALLTDTVPEVEDREDPFGRRELANTYKALARCPLYVGAHVRNPLALAGTLTAIRTAAMSAAPGLVTWGEKERYRDIPIVAIVPDRMAVGMSPGVDELAVHYAVAGGAILVSLDLPTLKTLVDAALDGRLQAPVDKGDSGFDTATQTGLRVDTGEGGWLSKTVLALLESEVRRAYDDTVLDLEALANGLGGLPAEGAERKAKALAYLGYEPLTVQGGTFSQTDDGLISHSLYGSRASLRYPELPIAGAPLTEFVSSLKSLSVGVAVEGEGKTQGLRIQGRWERKPLQK